MLERRMNPDNPKDPLVWSVFDNAWVPLSYWRLMNPAQGRGRG
jgi:hypothetical protein